MILRVGGLQSTCSPLGNIGDKVWIYSPYWSQKYQRLERIYIVIDWNKLNSFRNMCLTNKTSEHSHSLKHHVQPPFVSKLPQVSCLEEKMESHLLAFTLPRLGIEGVWGSTLHCSRFYCRSRECRDNGKPSSATFEPTHWVTEGSSVSKHLAVITPTVGDQPDILSLYLPSRSSCTFIALHKTWKDSLLLCPQAPHFIAPCVPTVTRMRADNAKHFRAKFKGSSQRAKLRTQQYA